MATACIWPRGINREHAAGGRRGERGFSLVSVVLTTVLMGLLAGLLGVAVWTARGAAERTACTMHLRQLSNALMMYKAENGDYPLGAYEVCNEFGELEIVTWEEALSPYLGKRQNLLECPACSNKKEQTIYSSVPNYEYARMNVPAQSRAGANYRPMRLIGRINPAAAAKSGALLACLHHDTGTPTHKRWTLVAYEDGSVKWEPSPDFLQPKRPPIESWRQRGFRDR